MTSYRHPSGLGGGISGVYIPTEYRERGHVFTDVPRDTDQRSSGADMRKGKNASKWSQHRTSSPLDVLK